MGKTWDRQQPRLDELVFNCVNACTHSGSSGNLCGTETCGDPRGNVRTMIKATCFTEITAVKDAVNERRPASCDKTAYLDRPWPSGMLILLGIHRCLLFRRLMRARTSPFQIASQTMHCFPRWFAYFSQILSRRVSLAISFIENSLICFYFVYLDNKDWVVWCF